MKMRNLSVILVLSLLAGCASDKFSDTPKAKGEWSQANSDPSSTDNNIVPLDDQDGGP